MKVTFHSVKVADPTNAKLQNPVHQNAGPVRLRNYSKINHENTKQDIQIKLAAFGGTSLTG